jgi:hypothetical protein
MGCVFWWEAAGGKVKGEGDGGWIWLMYTICIYGTITVKSLCAMNMS